MNNSFFYSLHNDKVNFLRSYGFETIGNDKLKANYYRRNLQKAYKEGYEEFKKTANLHVFESGKYYIHPSVNLYLDITGKCNCNCHFCIAKTTYERNDCDDSVYVGKLKKAINLLTCVNPSVQIVGGEPTCKDNLVEIIDVINASKLRRPVLGTNGWRLFEYITKINSSRIEYINVSRHHYNDNINAEIMSVYADVSDYLVLVIKKLKKSIRIQCNFIKNYIDTYGEVMQFIAYCYHKLGVTNISFSELTPLPKNDIYKESIIEYVKNHPVDLCGILKKIEKDSRFNFKRYRAGVACYYEIWEFTAYEKPITIVFKFSDNNWLKKADDDKEFIPDLILHTDGTLCGSWNKNKKILLQ